MKTKLFAAKDCIKRNFGKIIKTIWLIILLCICVFYIKVNYSRMVTGMIQLDYIVVLLSIVLALMPLVSEIDLWGLKVKREIQRVEKELNREIIYLHKQMINVETNNSQNINFSFLPTKEEIMADKKDSNQISKKEDEKMLFLLQARIALEKEVDRIISPIGINKRGLGGGVRLLKNHVILQDKEWKMLLTINDICVRSVHGEIISDEYYNYVKDNLPTAIGKLRSIELPISCV